MNDPVFNFQNVIYWLTLALVITTETVSFGLLWKRREAARWTMGYATVFCLSMPLVMLGYWDINTWIGLFFGVGIAGAIKTGFEAYTESQAAARLRAERGNANGTASGIGK